MYKKGELMLRKHQLDPENLQQWRLASRGQCCAFTATLMFRITVVFSLLLFLFLIIFSILRRSLVRTLLMWKLQ